MAELAVGAASPVVGLVMKKLASELWKELGLVRFVRTDIQKLQSKLLLIQNVLHDAERRSITDEGEALRGWLRKLRDAALDAEDVIEEFETEALRRRMERYDLITGKVRDFYSSNNPIAFRYKMASKIKEIRERFDEIAEENKEFNLMVKSDSDRPVDRETCSLVVESEIYGRDEDEKEVMKFLIDEDNGKNISVLSIFGLGGVGKTTLAQLVYNKDRVKEQFELRAWVCVGDHFDVKVVSQKMIEQVKGGTSDHTLNLDANLSFLQEKMRTTKFLLVMDDLWMEKESEWDKWDRLQPLFNQAKLGSKIIITTRFENVARMTGTVSPYRLKELQFSDCWTIFRKRAFMFEEEEENPELVEIGKEIIKKCGGLPLAAKVLGSLMSSKRGKAEWQAIRDDDIWRFSVDEIGVLPTLKLSYDHLPSHLKRCFTYCSMFPKDHIFEINNLIQLWMAEGLIDTSDTSLHTEDIGKQYFNNLLQRSFFQDVIMEEDSNILTCQMHDLVHDLACSLTKDESFVMEKGKENIPSECRYLSIVDIDVSSTPLKIIYKAKKLRSLVMLHPSYFNMHEFILNMHEFMFNVTKNLTQLHALDLNGYEIKRLSSRISRLKHLRLLDLSWTSITTLPTSITSLYNLQTLNLLGCEKLQELPESISRLYNLQTLNLKYCYKLRELPEDINNLINLRHLDISECQNMSSVPRGLGRLSNLQTLGMFIVAQENGCNIMELQHLNSIQGSLEIRDLQHVKDPNEAMQANLKAKTRLDGVVLQWKEGSNEAKESSSINVTEEVLERLQPYHNLKKLGIHYYMGTRLPTWMLSSLSKLVELELLGLERCGCLLRLSRFPSLKKLTMGGMHDVRRIGKEFYGDNGDSGFPLLEKLCLYNMPNLEEWDTEPIIVGRKMMIFCYLINLEIQSCPKLTVQPCIPCSVENLEIQESNEMLLSAGSLAGLSKLKCLSIDICGVSSSSSSEWWDGLQCATGLDMLSIQPRDELTCLPEGIMCLPFLRALSIMKFKNLNLNWEGRKQKQRTPFFAALRFLSIGRANELTALPEWIGGITSLYQLQIYRCPKLVMLPDSLRQLTALKKLFIHYCPQLMKHCKRETGEDWHKIAHIPYINIMLEDECLEEDRKEAAE